MPICEMDPFVFPSDPMTILDSLNDYFRDFEDYYSHNISTNDLNKEVSEAKRDLLLSVIGNDGNEALKETLENPEQESYELIQAAFRAKYATPTSTFKALKEFRNLVQGEDEDLENFVAQVSRQSLLIRAACDADRNLAALDQVHIGMRNWVLRDMSVANEWDLETLLENKDNVENTIDKDPTIDFQNIGLPSTLIIRKNTPIVDEVEDGEVIIDDNEPVGEASATIQELEKNNSPKKVAIGPDGNPIILGDDEDEENQELAEDMDDDDDDRGLSGDSSKMTMSGITITVKSSSNIEEDSEKAEKKRKMIEKMFKDIKSSSKEFKYKRLEPRVETEEELFKGLRNKMWYKSPRSVKKIKPMICQYCNALFGEKKEYYAHKQKVCNTCHKCFNKKSGLALHLVQVHGDTSNQCNQCGKIYSCKSGLELHVQIVHEKNQDYKCTQCEKGFPVERMLVNHFRLKHSKENRFVCDRCSKPFDSNSLLTKHIDSVHEKKVAAICHICSKSFTSESCYRAHVLRVHENIRKFECDICLARFHAGADLRKHKKGVHDKILDNICEYCNKGFSRKSILNKHIKSIHTQERDYQCGMCPNAYVSRYNLLRHIQEAHEHVKQICDICDKEIAGFGTGNLAKHKRIVHGIHTVKSTHSHTIISDTIETIIS